MSGSVSLINGHIDPDTSRMTDKEKIRYLNKCEDREQTVVVIWKVTEQKPDKITIGDVVDIINRQQAEIERLNKLLETRHKVFETKCEELEIAKAEAIKEFWGKLWELDPEIISKVVSFDLDELNNLKKRIGG